MRARVHQWSWRLRAIARAQGVPVQDILAEVATAIACVAVVVADIVFVIWAGGLG